MDDWDSWVLESAGWGTEEDYGYFGEPETRFFGDEERYEAVRAEMFPEDYQEMPW